MCKSVYHNCDEYTVTNFRSFSLSVKILQKLFQLKGYYVYNFLDYVIKTTSLNRYERIQNISIIYECEDSSSCSA